MKTLREVANLTGVHYNTVWRWIDKGWLPAHKLGGRWRVKEEDLEEFMKGENNGKRG